MGEHAKLSPSSAHRWMVCAGSVAMEKGMLDTASESATEGTLAHALAAVCLEGEHDAAYFVGTLFKYKDHGVDKEARIAAAMAEAVQVYVNDIRQYAAGGELYVEQRLPFFTPTGYEEPGRVQVPEQFGTTDALIILPSNEHGTELQVHDLKFGMGNRVDAFDDTGLGPNKQLALYALGAYYEHELVHDIKHIRLVIHQPRLKHTSEFDMTVEQLLTFEEKARHAALIALSVVETKGPFLEPGESQCRYCKAKAVCPALRQQVLSTVADDFVDLDKPIEEQIASTDRVTDNALLGRLLAAVPMIEAWCKALYGRAHSELMEGREVEGFKLVKGKQGNRAWSSAEEAEAMLKAMRLKKDEMYSLSLISPTECEKVLKDTPKKWAKVLPLISRADGRPSVAPASDKRPQLVIEPKATPDDFGDVTGALPDDGSDLV